MDNVLDMQVSMLTNFFDKEPVMRPLRDVVQLAQSNEVKRQTLEIRRLRGLANNPATAVEQAVQAKSQADKLKNHLCTFLTNVVCQGGKKRENIVQYLPLMGFDVDELTEDQTMQLMQLLEQDTHVVFAEPSCSRHGVHFVLLTDAGEWLNTHWDGKDTKPYSYVWQQARSYAEDTFKVVVDARCRNPEHIFAICYDDLVHSNSSPQPLHIDTQGYQAPATRQAATIAASGTHCAALSQVVDRVLDFVGKSCSFAPGSRNEYVARLAFECNRYGVAQTEVENFCTDNFLQDGFGQEEILRTIRSAYSHTGEFGTLCATCAMAPSAKSNEKVVKNTISSTLDTEWRVAQVAQTEQAPSNGYIFSDKLGQDNLPPFLHPIFELHGQNAAKCDAQLLGILNTIGGIMGLGNYAGTQRSGIYGIYDGRRIYAPVYQLVYSSAGNDKGLLGFCRLLAKAVRREMHLAYEQQHAAYEAQMAIWQTKGKHDRGVPPKEPAYQDPFVPGNSSSSAVYRALEANGGAGILFETEADTVSIMMESDFGNYSDLMRKAHHHETISMDRVTDKVHIHIDEPRLAIFLTCTPGQLPALFPSFENGLGSRFLFYHIPDDDVCFHDVFAHMDTPLEDIYTRMGCDLLPLYHALLQRAGHPIQFMLSDRQQQEFLDTFGGMLEEKFHMLGSGIRAFVFRMALEAFRYAMILTTVRRLDEWREAGGQAADARPAIFREEENGLICDERDFRTAMTIMECLINHTARVYAVMAKEEDSPFARKRGHLEPDARKLYEALPEGEFHTADLLRIADSLNIAKRTAQRYQSNFCDLYGIITPMGRRGCYYKPADKQAGPAKPYV